MAQGRLGKVAGHIAESSETFLFSLDQNNLTESQRRQYETDGFIVVKGLLDDHDIHGYLERFKEICALPRRELKKPNFTVMRDVSIAKSEYVAGESAITKLQDWQDDAALFEFCTHPKILEYVRSFCGNNVKSIHTMLINKPPDTGAGTSRHPMHQDLHYFPMRPADRIVCAWAALERVHRDNGCLTVIPGSHRQYPLLQHDYPDWEGGVNKLYHGVKIDSDVMDRRIFVEMDKGDVVFFHPLLIHGSGTNRTSGFRKAISCHYASSDCYCINIANTTQEHLAKEAAEAFRSRSERLFGVKFEDITQKQLVHAYTEFWKLKSRLVSGKQGTF